MKICSMRAGGRTAIQTDMTRLTTASHHFANPPKNSFYFVHIVYFDSRIKQRLALTS